MTVQETVQAARKSPAAYILWALLTFIIVSLLFDPFIRSPGIITGTSVVGLPWNQFIKDWTSRVTPWLGPLATIILVRYQIRKIRTRTTGWRVAPIFIIAFAGTCLAYLTVGDTNTLYIDIYKLVVMQPGSLVLTIQAVTYATAYLMLAATSWMKLDLLVFAVLGLLGNTPILNILSPQVANAVEWMVGQNIASVEVVFTSYWNSIIGIMLIATLIINVWTGRDDLRPR